MRVISLFAGIGGFDLGFERAGHQVVAQVEINARCRDLLARRFPGAILHDDVTTAGRHNLPDCDIITFGFPCQDLSQAGQRAGLKGARSGLYYEAVRIISELQPSYCLFENVPGLFSSDGGYDFARVLAALAECGYFGAWRVLDCQWIGLAQRRRRIFGLFSRLDSGAGRCAEILSVSKSLRGHPAPCREAGQAPAGVAGTLSANGGGTTRPAGNCNELDFCVPVVCGTLCDGAHSGGGLSGQDAYSERVIPVVTAGTLRASLGGGNRNRLDACVLVAPAIRYVGTAKIGDTRGQDPVIPCFWDGGQTCQTIDTVVAKQQAMPEKQRFAAVITQQLAVRRLTPRECERLQGFPDDWTVGYADSVRYRMLGNAVAVPCSEWIARRMADA